jgi:hypothetical protein
MILEIGELGSDLHSNIYPFYVFVMITFNYYSCSYSSSLCVRNEYFNMYSEVQK